MILCVLFAALLVMAQNPGGSEVIECKEMKAKNTTSRISMLRELMKKNGLAAYIVPMADDHQSEFFSFPNRRLEYLSGFSGSAGTGVVTLNEAALWTDSRYYIQAKKQLDCNWSLIKGSEKESPSIEKWLSKILKPWDKVASDPRKMNYNDWINKNKTLCENDIQLVPLASNLIDEIWKNKPQNSKEPVFIYEEKYSGESWIKKLERLRNILASHDVDLFTITNLDEIAWLFNLRGNDVQYSPLFYSYSIISPKEAYLYISMDKISREVQEYLTVNESGVSIRDYESFWTDLQEMEKSACKILVPVTQNYSRGASYKVYSLIQPEKILQLPSPIIDMRAYKNEIEANGMRTAHVKDAIALCELMYIMENHFADEDWDELKVSAVLDLLRSKQKLYMGSSFPSIVAFGKNSALPHYVPNAETNQKIETSAPLTIDSGGQYLDGTIDTTRVLHFGKPTEFEKEVYTVLIKGVADLASTVFPAGITLQELDFVIRRPLFQHGFNYGHGSTHGTGVFLGVHEAFNYTYDVNFIGSQEPGFYKDNMFGMRLENLVIVVPSLVENHTNKRLLTFEPLTLVPYEINLINKTLLDKSQMQWLDNYHKKVLEIVGKEMMKQGKCDLYKWLQIKTKPISTN